MTKGKARLMVGIGVSLLIHLSFFFPAPGLPVPRAKAQFAFISKTGGRTVPGTPRQSLPGGLSAAVIKPALSAEDQIRLNTDHNPVESEVAERPGSGRSAFVDADPAFTFAYAKAREAFISRLAGRKVYPPPARQRNIQGTVELCISLSPQGGLSTLEIIRSSGSDILDRAARLLVERSLPFEHGLDGVFTVDIMIDYSLIE